MPARHNKKGRSLGGGRFVQLHHYLLRSPAWRSLTPAARAIYVEVAMLYDGSNNGYLALAVRDAGERCRVNKDTAGRAFKELVQAGFLERAQAGGFAFKLRHATEWRLTNQKCDRTGALASKTFLKTIPRVGESGTARSDIEGQAVPKKGTIPLRLVIGGPSMPDLQGQ